MLIGIKDNKVWDICSDNISKRQDGSGEEIYLEADKGDYYIGDSWKNGKSLKDSPQRDINWNSFKNPLELRFEELEARITELEKKK